MSRCCCSSSCCGDVSTAENRIPRVDSKIGVGDTLKRIFFRLGIGRMNMTVPPGLYAFGSPNPEDPVIVSANFRLTFDQLRKKLESRNAWLLILNTKGINVWCAAGKGTFGTEELVRQIESFGLKSFISHNNLILPQLGAPGIKAHEVKSRTGFRVHYGPVSLDDLGTYLDAGMKASREMRRIAFPFLERLELVPLEMVQAWKILLAMVAVSSILSLILLGPEGMSLLYDVVPAVIAVVCGAFITPLLLPYIPGRAFSLKGALVGTVFSGVFIGATDPPLSATIFIAGIIIAISSFLAMNFTGASTFTSLSGVKKEIRYAMPFQGGLVVAAIFGRILLELVSKGGAGV